MTTTSAIEELLEIHGCGCGHHPDDRPEGVEFCLGCRARAEWQALKLRCENAELALVRLRVTKPDLDKLRDMLTDLRLAQEAHERVVELLKKGR
jgi:hypothetical protein